MDAVEHKGPDLTLPTSEWRSAVNTGDIGTMKAPERRAVAKLYFGIENHNDELERLQSQEITAQIDAGGTRANGMPVAEATWRRRLREHHEHGL